MMGVRRKRTNRLSCETGGERAAVHVPHAMGEAYHYKAPAAFSRGMVVPLPGAKLVFVSGTASIGEDSRE